MQIRRHQRAGGAEGTGASVEDVNWVRQDIRALQDDVLDRHQPALVERQR